MGSLGKCNQRPGHAQTTSRSQHIEDEQWETKALLFQPFRVHRPTTRKKGQASRASVINELRMIAWSCRSSTTTKDREMDLRPIGPRSALRLRDEATRCASTRAGADQLARSTQRRLSQWNNVALISPKFHGRVARTGLRPYTRARAGKIPAKWPGLPQAPTRSARQ